jgi:hypothetical protein
MADDEELAASNSDGSKENNRPSLGLQFVNMNASSQEERQRNQKVIRSAAMRSFRLKQKLQQKEAKVGSCAQGVLSKKQQSPKSKSGKDLDENYTLPRQNNGWLSEDASSGSSMLGSVSPPTKGIDDDFALGRPFRSATPCSLSSRNSPLIGSPISPLGAGRIDPFRIYPVDFTGPLVHELIDHCKSYSPKFLRLRSHSASIDYLCVQLSLSSGLVSAHVARMALRARFRKPGSKKLPKDQL